MTDHSAPEPLVVPAASGPSDQLARRAEAFVLPLAALLAGFAVFSIFLLLQGKSPVQFFSLTYQAGFGTAFS